jgi:hypothetical protein
MAQVISSLLPSSSTGVLSLLSSDFVLSSTNTPLGGNLDAPPEVQAHKASEESFPEEDDRDHNSTLNTTTTASTTTIKARTIPTYKRQWVDDESHAEHHRGFDRVAPRLVRQKTPIVPGWETTIFSLDMLQSNFNLQKPTFKKEDRNLFMYNPSIVPIPRAGTAGSNIREDLIGTSADDTEVNKRMRYIASFRLSTMSTCLNQKVKNKVKEQNLLSLVLLDEQLNIIRGTETILDINAQAARWISESSNVQFEDFRLFILSNAENDGRKSLYLADGKHILPIRLLRKDAVALPVENAPFNAFPAPTVQYDGLSVVPQGPAYQVTGDRKMVWKNHNFFTVPGRSSIFMEMMPLGPRKIGEFQFPTLASSGNVPLVQISSMSRQIGNVNIHQPNKNDDLPPPAHVAADSNSFTGSSDRGSACCARLQRDIYQPYLNATKGLSADGKDLLGKESHLLFGFSHSQSKLYRGAYHHLSRLYAFLPYPPFTIVAMSGYFCLPPPHSNPSSKWVNHTREKGRLYMGKGGRQRYYCPRIHFISGMSETAAAGENGGNEIILTYGVNDCVSQFAVMDKDEIAKHLF